MISRAKRGFFVLFFRLPCLELAVPLTRSCVVMSKKQKNLQADYLVARESGDWKEAGSILIKLSNPFPCLCSDEHLRANNGQCHCDRYASLLRPATAQELMLSGC